MGQIIKTSSSNDWNQTKLNIGIVCENCSKYNGLPGDCIMVFGSNKATKYRVPKAVELYQDTRAKKLLMSGGKEIDIGGRRILEALVMQEKAMEFGVPAEDIIIETFSQRSTKENIIGSLLQLDRTIGLNKIKRMLLVTTLYHMRRCILMARTYMPDWFEFSMCPANDINTLRYNGFLNEGGTPPMVMSIVKKYRHR